MMGQAGAPGSSRIRRGCPDGDRAPLEAGPARPCAFLDRDGVINEDYGYVNRIEQFVWVPGAKEAVDMLKSQGYWVVVATNQSGIERGYYTEDDFLALSVWLLEQLPVDLILYCPHLDSPCPARKPGAGMLESAASILPICRERSFFVGDKETDMTAAAAFGVPGLMYHSEWGPIDSFLIEQGLFDEMSSPIWQTM